MAKSNAISVNSALFSYGFQPLSPRALNSSRYQAEIASSNPNLGRRDDEGGGELPAPPHSAASARGQRGGRWCPHAAHVRSMVALRSVQRPQLHSEAWPESAAAAARHAATPSRGPYSSSNSGPRTSARRGQRRRRRRRRGVGSTSLSGVQSKRFSCTFSLRSSGGRGPLQPPQSSCLMPPLLPHTASCPLSCIILPLAPSLASYRLLPPLLHPSASCPSL